MDPLIVAFGFGVGALIGMTGGGSQMAILVKPDGLLGHVYMAAIKPFRHRIVYPPMLRQIEREWRASRVAG